MIRSAPASWCSINNISDPVYRDKITEARYRRCRGTLPQLMIKTQCPTISVLKNFRSSRNNYIEVGWRTQYFSEKKTGPQHYEKGVPRSTEMSFFRQIASDCALCTTGICNSTNCTASFFSVDASSLLSLQYRSYQIFGIGILCDKKCIGSQMVQRLLVSALFRSVT